MRHLDPDTSNEPLLAVKEIDSSSNVGLGCIPALCLQLEQRAVAQVYRTGDGVGGRAVTQDGGVDGGCACQAVSAFRLRIHHRVHTNEIIEKVHSRPHLRCRAGQTSSRGRNSAR